MRSQNFISNYLVRALLVGGLGSSAHGVDFLDFASLTDLNGASFGTVSGQQFELGSDLVMTINWSGDFNSGGPTPSADGSISNEVGFSGGATLSNVITIDFNQVVQFVLESQAEHFALRSFLTESGNVLTSGGDGFANISDPEGYLTNSDSSRVDYRGKMDPDQSEPFVLRGEGNQLVYNYSVFNNGFNSNLIIDDAFRVAVVPEPSSSLLCVSAMLLLARRRRTSTAR